MSGLSNAYAIVAPVAVPVAIALVGLGASAVFSGIETGLYTINRVRLAVRAGRGDRRAMQLRSELARPGRTLVTILIGNNIANYLGSLGVAALLLRAELGPASSVAVNTLVLVPLLFIFGEVLPKDLFRAHTDSWSYRWVGVLRAVRRAFTVVGLVPLVEGAGWLIGRALGGRRTIPDSGRVRMAELMKEGAGAGVLTEAQLGLFDRALTMGQRTVASEMRPWRAVVRLRADASGPALPQVPTGRPFSRMPVVDARGQVVGVLGLLDALLDPKATVRALMRPPLILPPTMRALDALTRMRERRVKMAVVAEPSSGRPLGLVTLHDLVEPLSSPTAGPGPGATLATPSSRSVPGTGLSH